MAGRKAAAPHFDFEAAALARGVFPVCGIDEAGRGPWAGPVVAAAVILDRGNIPVGLDDSKRLSAARRELLFAEIMASAHVGTGAIQPLHAWASLLQKRNGARGPHSIASAGMHQRRRRRHAPEKPVQACISKDSYTRLLSFRLLSPRPASASPSSVSAAGSGTPMTPPPDTSRPPTASISLSPSRRTAPGPPWVTET